MIVSCSGSTTNSIEVLIASKLKTSPIATMINIQSIRSIFNTNPNMIIIMAAKMCNKKFWSF